MFNQCLINVPLAFHGLDGRPLARPERSCDHLVELAPSPERRDRVRGPRTPRHRAIERVANFSASFTALGEIAYDGAQVSASVVDLDSNEPLASIDERIALPTASIGKILLLVELFASQRVCRCV